MSFRNTAAIALSAWLSLAVCGCGLGRSAEQELGTGRLSGRTYTHDYFDLTVRFPPEWHILSRAEVQNARNVGRQYVAGNNAALQAGMKSSERRSIFMVSASRRPPAEMRRGEFNYNVCIVAERAPVFSGLKTGADYLLATRKLFKRTGLNVLFGEIETGRKIGRFVTDCQQITVKVGNRKIYQQHCAVRVKDYFLVFVLSYENGMQYRELKQILENVA
jgi:hypothetical protein